MSIFLLLVISWAYAIAVFALVQSAAFQAAVDAQQFRRQVRRLVEPRHRGRLRAAAGRIVGADLDEHYRRFVVIDKREERVQSVVTEQLAFDVPCGPGATAPHRRCSGWLARASRVRRVLALTNDDDANLAVVMTAALLRPDLPVLGRCAAKRTLTRMDISAPDSAINADDRVWRLPHSLVDPPPGEPPPLLLADGQRTGAS